ncbi:MAG: peptidoglycan-binding domain-containing protein [Ferrovibrio sp.]
MHKTKLHLRAALSPDHLAEPDDILDTKKILMALGYYRPLDGDQPGAWVDNGLFAGIRQFQRDNGLKVDALLRPGGPTEQAMNASLEDAPQNPPANDDQPPANENNPDVALMDCDHQRFLDEMKCKSLLNPVARAQCFSSSMVRYSNCRAKGYPYPELFLG